MSHSGTNEPVSVSLLALPETTPTAIYGLLELFSAVGVTWSQLTGETVHERRMAARIVARERRPIDTPLGVAISPHETIDEVERAHVIIVTDLILSVDGDPRGQWKAEAAWVREKFEQGAMICSVCTGSVFVAEAGLLDGMEATTHWSAADIFQRYYPKITLRPERILSPAGPEHRIVTGGGASSWEDLALYLVARFCGAAEAVRIAKIFVLGDRSEGQLPFSAMGKARRHEDAVVAECQAWIANHYVASNPVARLVERSGLPPRTFKRRFKSATGYSPVDYVQALRIEEAKQILETTSEPTDSVAHAVGYDDPAFFRRLFKRRTGVTPARYRRRFQSILRAE